MQHALVQRVSVVLTLLLVAAAGLFAWSVRDGSQVGQELSAIKQPELAFAQHCARCHEVGELSEILRSDRDPTMKVLDWIELLQTHGGTDVNEDQAIVLYLLLHSRGR